MFSNETRNKEEKEKKFNFQIIKETKDFLKKNDVEKILSKLEQSKNLLNNMSKKIQKEKEKKNKENFLDKLSTKKEKTSEESEKNYLSKYFFIF